jgi:pimeloyl-ACP methyl ester carboxylesterase
VAPVDLAVREYGAGSPLVILHAFPLPGALLEPLATRLAGFRVLVPDLRGWGSSPLGDDAPSLPVLADDVVAMLDRYGLGRAVVGGVSMGGYVTMELLRRRPDRLAGALLLDTKADADTEAARSARLSMAQAVLRDGRDVLAPLLDGLLGATTRQSRPDVVATVRGWLEQADPAAVAWAQRAMASRPSSHATLAAAEVPLGVLVGEEDTLTPPDAASAMARARPGTPCLVVPGCGHLAVVEDPDAAAAAVLRLLQRVG